MTINVHVVMLPPKATRRKLAVFERKSIIQMTPGVLEAVLNGTIPVDSSLNATFKSYDKPSNTIKAELRMGNGRRQYMKELQEDGWRLNAENATACGLPNEEV